MLSIILFIVEKHNVINNVKHVKLIWVVVYSVAMYIISVVGLPLQR